MTKVICNHFKISLPNKSLVDPTNEEYGGNHEPSKFLIDKATSMEMVWKLISWSLIIVEVFFCHTRSKHIY